MEKILEGFGTIKANNMQTGERIEAGPHAILPGGLNFWGSGIGGEDSEYEKNFEAFLLSQ